LVPKSTVLVVSTHSRLKAAGVDEFSKTLGESKFQHTAA